jgi:RimJ/RimL family protein N-acetyltransferase
MATNVTVTRVVEDDAAELLEMLRQASEETDYLSFTGGLGISLDEERAYLRSLDESTSGTMLKAVVDGVIAGSASITRGKGVRFRHAGDIGVAVLREHWGRGVGRALMQGIVSEGQRLGLRRLALKVRVDYLRAIALYESLGFRHEGRLIGAFAVGDTLYDDLQMGLLYDAGPSTG